MQGPNQLVAAARDLEAERDRCAAFLRHGSGPTAIETRRVRLSESGNAAGQCDRSDAHQGFGSPKSLLVHEFPFQFFIYGWQVPDWHSERIASIRRAGRASWPPGSRGSLACPGWKATRTQGLVRGRSEYRITGDKCNPWQAQGWRRRPP